MESTARGVVATPGESLVAVEKVVGTPKIPKRRSDNLTEPITSSSGTHHCSLSEASKRKNSSQSLSWPLECLKFSVHGHITGKLAGWASFCFFLSVIPDLSSHNVATYTITSTSNVACQPYLCGCSKATERSSSREGMPMIPTTSKYASWPTNAAFSPVYCQLCTKCFVPYNVHSSSQELHFAELVQAVFARKECLTGRRVKWHSTKETESVTLLGTTACSYI